MLGEHEGVIRAHVGDAEVEVRIAVLYSTTKKMQLSFCSIVSASLVQ